MAFIGRDDILVLQKDDGRVRRVINGVLQSGEVLDVAVDFAGEGGLLGIAIHPDFPTTPFVYLYYTESSTGSDVFSSAVGNRVYRFVWDGTALINPTLILNLPSSGGHNGGVITFGPDGKLYVIIGDLGQNGQLQNVSTGNPPDDTSVILRLNDDGTVPINNPFFSLGDPVNKYYAYGIRNSFGIAFDPVTGKLWDTENGPNVYDEINLIEPGFNSGWEKIMGPDSRDPDNLSDLFSLAGSHYADPKFSWQNPIGVTAIVFFESPQLGPQYENDVFVGNVNNDILYRFQPNALRNGFKFSTPGLSDLVVDNGDNFDEIVFGTGFSYITDLKVGPDGFLYVLSLLEGKIYRISSAVPFFINASSLPDGEVEVNYSADLEILGGTPPYTVARVNGRPVWLTTVSSDSIAGMPTRSDKFFFTLQVTDQVGTTVRKRFDITVRKPLRIVNQRLKTGRVNQNYRAELNAVRGKKPFTWSLISGALPNGLQLDQSMGIISGVPTAAISSGLTVEVTDPLGGSDQKTLTLTINP